MGRQKPDALSHLDIETLDKTLLIDIQEITVDRNLPTQQRMLQYLEQIKNPYCFLCGEIPVKVCFAEDGEDFETVLKKHFIALKR